MLSGPAHNNQCKSIGCCCEDEAELQIPLVTHELEARIHESEKLPSTPLRIKLPLTLLISSFETWSLMKYIRFCPESHIKTRMIANCFGTFNNSNYWHQWSTSVCQALCYTGDYTRRHLFLPITLSSMLLSLPLVCPFFFF